MSNVRLIDANALKKSAYPFPCAIGVEYAVPIRAVDEAPTIDPVRHARWVDVEILDEDDEGISYTMTWFKCSACGWRVLFNFQKSNHCHNCGARMDEEVLSEMETTTEEEKDE